jgi:predicted permease
LRLWTRFLHLLKRDRFEDDLDQELRFHREMAQQDLLRRGVPTEDITAATARALGNITLAQEDSREVWNFAIIESLLQDIRYAIRGFLQKPAFAATVIGTIGLALGLNTTVFTIFNAYVLRTFAVRDPYALQQFKWVTKNGPGHRFSWREFEELRRQKIAFDGLFACQTLQVRLEGFGTIGQLVSGDYFSTLGAGPSQGRTLLPEDAAVPGSGAVMVLSYGMWKNRFGADPNILGRKIMLHSQPLVVVGVTRPEFSGIENVPIDYWIPLSMAPLLDDSASLFGPGNPGRLWIVGRLKPDIAPEQAKAELTVWSRRTTAALPESEWATGAVLIPRATSIPINTEMIAIFAPLVVAFALVLLIACANVANMMLARGLARQREIGIRLSLGAARSRLIRQLLTESLLLALPAAAAGFIISQATIHLATKLMYATIPSEVGRWLHIADLSPDAHVFAFILIASVLCTVAFGLAPALQATRSTLVEANRGDFSNEHRPARLRNALVISQVTVCALLLICAAVVLRNGRNVAAQDVRLSTHGVLDVHLQERFQAKAAERLRSEPWVESVAAAWRAPLYGSLRAIPISTLGASGRLRAGYNFVSPEYFSAFRIPVLRGSNFSSEEANAGAPLAIVSERTAARLWPDREALGQSFQIAPDNEIDRYNRLPKFASARVIGVVGDVMSGRLADGLDSTLIYFPTSSVRRGNDSLLVRVKGDPEAMRSALDAVLAGTVPGAVDQINPMEQVLAMQIYPFRIFFWLLAFLGGLALVLTVSGIYGVLSYLVSQRMKEIGIRIALGASTGGVVRFVLRQSMRLAVAGITLGVLLALGVARLIASQLVMVNLFDTVAYLAVVLLVSLAALAASFFPAYRAVNVDTATTLRCD